MQEEQRTIRKKPSENLQDWLDGIILDRQIKNLSPGSIRFYKQKLHMFVDWCSNQEVCIIQEITPNLLRLFLVELKTSRGNNNGGVPAYYRAIRAWLNWFEDEAEPPDWLNPIRKVHPPKVQQEPLEPVSLVDVQRLVEGSPNPRDKAIWLFLLDSGVRASELLSIELNDLNLIQGSAVVRGKGGKVRTVVIGKSTRKAVCLWLRKRPEVDGFLFCKTNGERLTYNGLRSLLLRTCERVGVEEVSLHDFRRAFCLQQLQRGTPETTIARLMGHANTSLIAIHARQTPRELVSTFHSIVDEKL